MIRSFLLYLLYLKNRVAMKHVKFRGFTVVFAFPKSKIQLGRGIINSSWSSNMLGLWQRTIIVARYGGKIEIGDGYGISGCTIYATQSIVIGENAMIGANCKIVDNDFHPLEPEYRRLGLNEEHARRKGVRIGNDCFIGMSSIILKGTELGDNVVVGAGSVVCGVFPDNCVIAGNPAKIIGHVHVS